MEIVFSGFKLELKTQNIRMKNVMPLCLQRKDSVKNTLIITIEKVKCIKFLL